MRRTVVALVLLIGALGALSGCAPASQPGTADPTPSSTPLFASEEEALAAATEAYAAYLKVSDAILADGGANPERIKDVATGQALKDEQEGYSKFSTLGYHSVGTTTFGNVVLQSLNSNADRGGEVVSVYLCADVSGVSVVDLAGVSMVSPQRPDRTGFEVRFSLDNARLPLKVSSKEVWDGDVCA